MMHRADDTHLKKQKVLGESTESLKKYPLPRLGDEENFEIYKL